MVVKAKNNDYKKPKPNNSDLGQNTSDKVGMKPF